MTTDIIAESKQQESQSRIKKFQAAFEALMKEYQVSVQPKISPDGPVNILVDTKYASHPASQ